MQIFWLIAIVVVVAFVAYYLFSQKKGSGASPAEKEEFSDEIMKMPAPEPAPPAETPSPIRPTEPSKPAEPTESANSFPEQGMDIDINNE